MASGVEVGSGSGSGVGCSTTAWVGVGTAVGVGGLSGVETVAVGSTASSLQGPEFEHGAMTMTNANARKRDTAQTLFRVMMFNLVTRLHRVMVMPICPLQ